MAEIVINTAISQGVSAATRTAAQQVGLKAVIGSALTRQLTSRASSFASRQIREAIFGSGGSSNIRGRELSSLDVQLSSYGTVIKSVYGASRIAGNVIWSRPIKETISASGDGIFGGKGGGGSSSTSKQRSYSVTLAIAICAGEIDKIERVWADAQVINPAKFSSSYRLYTGSKTQLPDPTIESFEGVGNVTAYRDLAYIVIEDFPLADYGNRIPNFTFEVKRGFAADDVDGQPLENTVKSMIMIPGSGEFVYDTVVQNKITGQEIAGQWVANGASVALNQHNVSNKSNSLVALDQLLDTCPNLEWIGLVVTWFGDDLDAGICKIRAGVEYDVGATTSPDLWAVAGKTRDTAYLISQDADGNPTYGGTPSDASLIRYIDEIKARGIKVMLYPMFFMDTVNKPWRGRVTGSVADVANFFTKTDGYNDFVNHYASLVVGKVDAFVIGSELIGLTKVRDVSDDSFPAVDALISLAATVKTTLGSAVKITYAADWSEYHHTDGGWYNLDPLWASANIDMVGIDAYFPLTDAPQDGYDVQPIIDGWTSGEGYDFYYADQARTDKQPLAAAYAWKNIDWWWNNTHTNPDSNVTPWVAGSKPIWFTEYGFPSLDGASNQPNVFYDPNSSESAFPRFSRGSIDNRAQRLGLAGTELAWQNSTMLANKFIWTWDARPYPFWPDLRNIWSDGPLWKTGHWLQGKLGVSQLGQIVADICRRSNMVDTDFDTSLLNDLVYGYVLDEQLTARQAIEKLQVAYFFDVVESSGILKFIPRGDSAASSNISVTTINSDQLISDKSDADNQQQFLSIKRQYERELPSKVDVTFIDSASNYLPGNRHEQRMVADSQEQLTLNLPIVMNGSLARSIASTTIFNEWTQRTSYSFKLPLSYLYLEPTDIITIDDSSNAVSTNHEMRIISIAISDEFLSVEAVAQDVNIYQTYNQSASEDELNGEANISSTDIISEVGDSDIEFLDLPLFPSEVEGGLRAAISGAEAGWNGAVIYRSDDDGVSYKQIAQLEQRSIIGAAVDVLSDYDCNIFDDKNTVTVIINSGELESVSRQAVLNGANIAVIGEEIIQFSDAQLLSTGKYRLSGLLRGRLGTEYATSSHVQGDRFVLINSSLVDLDISDDFIGLSRKYKIVSVGSTLDATQPVDFIYAAQWLKPLSPVHVVGNRDASSNLNISWIRRTRSNGQWRDNVDVPLSEINEQYDVEIMDGANVVRSFSAVTTPSLIYNASDQISDFGAVQSSVNVRIYQLSDAVGRGNVATKFI